MRAFAWLVALPVFIISCQLSSKNKYELIIRNGMIYDGNGKAPYRGDIAINKDTLTNGYHVAQMQPTEWLHYTVPAQKGIYQLQIRLAADQASKFDLYINGVKKADGFSVASTGERWTTITLKNIDLKGGVNQLKFVARSGAISLNYFQFVNLNNTTLNINKNIKTQ